MQVLINIENLDAFYLDFTSLWLISNHLLTNIDENDNSEDFKSVQEDLDQILKKWARRNHHILLKFQSDLSKDGAKKKVLFQKWCDIL
jgi:hypothetical protein